MGSKTLFFWCIMGKVLISKKALRRLNEHAKASLPEECVGIFECMYANRKWEVTDIYECKNIAEDKRYGAMLSKKDFKFFNNRRKKLEKHNIFYGVYHSHPITGSLDLSEQDRYSAKFYNLFKLQIVLGVKNRRSIKCMFWKKNAKSWRKSDLIKIA